MSDEEIRKLFCDYHNNYLCPILDGIDSRIEKLREELKKEHEDLLMRAVNAETKLKLYETLFSRLNLHMEVKNK